MHLKECLPTAEWCIVSKHLSYLLFQTAFNSICYSLSNRGKEPFSSFPFFSFFGNGENLEDLISLNDVNQRRTRVFVAYAKNRNLRSTFNIHILLDVVI